MVGIVSPVAFAFLSPRSGQGMVHPNAQNGGAPCAPMRRPGALTRFTEDRPREGGGSGPSSLNSRQRQCSELHPSEVVTPPPPEE